MRHPTRQSDVPDEVLLGWWLVWGVVLTIAMISLLAGSPAGNVVDGTQIVLGLAMGALAAVWISSGTWVGLIHLPVKTNDSLTAATVTQQPPGSGPEHQRIGPRIAVAAMLLADMAILAYGIRQDLAVVALLIVIAMIGVCGPLLIWQYTRQRIYRQSRSKTGQQSIRQILGLVFTIALASAALRLAERWFGLSGAMFALILSIGSTWTMMVWIMLGRWWWLVLTLLPVVAVQWLLVTALIDTSDPASEALIRRAGGVMVGHHLFAVLFLSLMRSSGHRWFVSPRG